MDEQLEKAPQSNKIEPSNKSTSTRQNLRKFWKRNRHIFELVRWTLAIAVLVFSLLHISC